MLVRARTSIAALALAAACADKPAPGAPPAVNTPTLTVTSPAFTEGSSIPAEYTCEGDDVSPPLAWSGAPPGTQSIAIIVDDPDAPDPAKPKRVWVHWVVYDLPPELGALARDAAAALPAGARHGNNDWSKPTWGGPCPPIGRHRYFHKVYALDRKLGDLVAPTKAALEDAMKGHILAQGQLVGTYAKTGG